MLSNVKMCSIFFDVTELRNEFPETFVELSQNWTADWTLPAKRQRPALSGVAVGAATASGSKAVPAAQRPNDRGATTSTPGMSAPRPSPCDAVPCSVLESCVRLDVAAPPQTCQLCDHSVVLEVVLMFML